MFIGPSPLVHIESGTEALAAATPIRRPNRIYSFPKRKLPSRFTTDIEYERCVKWYVWGPRDHSGALEGVDTSASTEPKLEYCHIPYASPY
jgi:hypothetical protein